jgi:toxin ParE1/3/4
VNRVQIASRALEDLDEIWDYIARDSPLNADRFLDRVKATFRDLTQMPGMGRAAPRPQFPDLRVFPFRGYLIYYQSMADDGVEIIRVLHGAMHQDAQWP